MRSEQLNETTPNHIEFKLAHFFNCNSRIETVIEKQNIHSEDEASNQNESAQFDQFNAGLEPVESDLVDADQLSEISVTESYIDREIQVVFSGLTVVTKTAVPNSCHEIRNYMGGAND